MIDAHNVGSPAAMAPSKLAEDRPFLYSRQSSCLNASPSSSNNPRTISPAVMFCTPMMTDQTISTLRVFARFFQSYGPIVESAYCRVRTQSSLGSAQFSLTVRMSSDAMVLGEMVPSVRP